MSYSSINIRLCSVPKIDIDITQPTCNAFLSVYCYICNKVTDNFEYLIVRKTGRKLFRIETNCIICNKKKSKMFCDKFNQLPDKMYNLYNDKIYVYKV